MNWFKWTIFFRFFLFIKEIVLGRITSFLSTTNGSNIGLRDYENERNKKNIHDASFIIENVLGQVTFIKEKKKKFIWSFFYSSSYQTLNDRIYREEFWMTKRKSLGWHNQINLYIKKINQFLHPSKKLYWL